MVTIINIEREPIVQIGDILCVKYYSGGPLILMATATDGDKLTLIVLDQGIRFSDQPFEKDSSVTSVTKHYGFKVLRHIKKDNYDIEIKVKQ